MSRKTGTLHDFEIAYHRNGVAGNGFYVVKFLEKIAQSESRPMLAIVFADAGNIAVFDLDKLAKRDIAFGSNSWRGDVYESEIREAIEAQK